MPKLSQQHLILFFIIVLMAMPNIVLIVIGKDSIVASLIKKIAFFIFSFSMILLPLLFIKPKIYGIISVILMPFVAVEIYHITTFRAPLSEEVLATALFNTNGYQNAEFVKGNILFILFFLALTALLVWLTLKIRSGFRLPKKLKLSIFFIWFIVTSSFLIRDYHIAKNSNRASTFNKKITITKYLFEVKLNKTFPIANFNKFIKVCKGQKNIKSYKERIKDYKFNAFKRDNLGKPEIYILVIGETTRKASFNFYGYERETNPKLAQIDNLLVFDNVKTVGNLTSTSFPFLLTRALPGDISQSLNEPTVTNAFKESNFKTYWLSNQAVSTNSVYAMYSRLSDYYKNISVSTDVAKFDGDLLPELDIVLKDNSSNKKFIVIHTLGSHYAYHYRYPDNFEIFKPTLPKTLSVTGNSVRLKVETINSYDNTILYIDYILSEIIKRLERENCLSYMFYISDHGENLYDDDNEYLLHGLIEPTSYEIDVPLFIWNSEPYIKQYPEKINNLTANLSSKISSVNTFETLLDMANITYNDADTTKSFTNKDFDVNQSRFLLTPDKRLLKLD